MEGKEQLAQEALRYLNLAQNFEEEKNFDKAIESVHASITPNIIKFYNKVSETLGSGISKKDKTDKDIQYM